MKCRVVKVNYGLLCHTTHWMFSTACAPTDLICAGGRGGGGYMYSDNAINSEIPLLRLKVVLSVVQILNIDS